MADNERTSHLKTVRAEIVEKRTYLIGRLIDNDARNSEEIYSIIETSLLNTQNVIETIDKAIEDEKRSKPSVYETRGLLGS